MPTISVETEFRAICFSCGVVLEVDDCSTKKGIPQITIMPCKNCLDIAETDGYNHGLADGNQNVVREETSTQG